jgi:excisionase family DNA binding protein
MAKSDTEAKQTDWFTIAEAAGYLGISEPTIYRWMRDGKLSFYKVGDSTRFKKENLDMVVEKYTGTHEADFHVSRCAVCGHSHLIAGRVQSTGNVYFRPARTRFFTLHQSLISVEARVCARCGYVQLYADPVRIDRLLRDEDREHEEAPVELAEEPVGERTEEEQT